MKYTKTQSDPDLIAENLMYLGSLARKMPPSFVSAGMSYHVTSDEGQIGKMIPGCGFLSVADLSNLGITKQLPNVYDPSRYRRIEDAVAKEMGIYDIRALIPIQGGAITSYDGIISARAGGKQNDIAFAKLTATTIANNWHLLWKVGGSPPGGTYSPTTTAPTDTLMDRTGSAAISTFLSEPSGTDSKYLLTFGFTAVQQINMAMLIDILSMSGSFRLTVTTAETVASPTNTTREYSPSGTGIGNLYTFIVATAGTHSASAATFVGTYINQAGSSGTSPTLTCTTGATLTADTNYISGAGFGSAQPPWNALASGDTGVRAIKQSQINSNAATSAIVEGIVYFPLSFVPGVAAQAYIERDSTNQIDSLVQLVSASSHIGHFALMVMPNTTSTGVLTGFIRTTSG